MVNWKFNANDVKESSYSVIPQGDHRVRVASVDEKKSKSGNDMLAITLDVSNYSGKLFFYLVFIPDNTTMTNTNLARFWDSFGIPQGNLDTASWVGKVGAAKVKHEKYNGEDSAKVSYFIERKKQDLLPSWVEKSGGVKPAANSQSAPFSTDDLPF